MTQNERRGLPIWKRIILLILTIIVFALQLALFALLFQINFTNQNTFAPNIIVYVVIEVIATFLVLHIIHKPILASFKLTWAILILALPLPATLLYYLNSRSKKLPRYKQKKVVEVLEQYRMDNQVLEELESIHLKSAKHARIIHSNTGFPVYKNTKYTFLEDGLLKFNDLMEELKKAKIYIFIETFIISDGYLLTELLKVLKERGEAGVEIKIIYDDLGSRPTLKSKTVKEITKIPNCQIVNYNPLGLNINPGFNYRDHRKITIIDGKIAYCGGDNFADEYIHKKERFGFWRDNCGKYEGEAVGSFVALFLETWYMSTKEILKLEKYCFWTDNKNDKSYIMPFGDGPSAHKNCAYDVFRSLISSADKTLYISTPYLVIDDGLVESITLACKSGVDVRILMPGVPDKKSAFYFARFTYQEILKAGGKIYEFTGGFNHAKNIMVDGTQAFIGTINMDYRSLFLHYECGALIFLDDEIKRMEEDFLKACEKSRLITYDDWKKRPWYQRLFAYLFYLFAPLF